LIGTPFIHYTINMKILVTGGNGKLPKKLKELNGDKYLTPTKEELNLLDKESIKNFFEHNQDIEGIIFSATLYPGQDMHHTEDWFNDDNLKILNKKNLDLQNSRLFLIKKIQLVLKSGLMILNVNAPTEM